MLKILLSSFIFISLFSFTCREYSSQVIRETETKHSSVQASSLVSLWRETYTYNLEFERVLNNYKSINPNVVGYIYNDTFNIYQPVLYSEDSNSYLNTNIYEEDEFSGSIFIDSRCSIESSPYLLIHGHNMKNGDMFANVADVLFYSTLDNISPIKYVDKYGYREYKVVSAFPLNAKEETINILPMATVDEVKSVVSSLIERSVVPISYIPDSIDTLILNTCWYGYTGEERNLRCIVIAVRDM